MKILTIPSNTREKIMENESYIAKENQKIFKLLRNIIDIKHPMKNL